MAKNQPKSGTLAPKSGVRLGLFLTILVSIVCAISFFIVSNVHTKVAKGFLEDGAKLQVLSQQIAKNASESAYGNSRAFQNLTNNTQQFDDIWDKVSKGKINSSLPIGPSFTKHATEEIGTIQAAWNSAYSNSKVILDSKDAILGLHKLAQTAEQQAPKINADVSRIVDTLVRTNASGSLVREAQTLEIISERLIRQINTILEDDPNNSNAAVGLATDIQTFSDIFNKLASNSVIQAQHRTAIASIRAAFDAIQAEDNASKELYRQYAKVKQSLAKIFAESNDLLSSINELSDKIDSEQSEIFNSFNAGSISAIIAALSMFGIFYLSAKETSARLSTEERVRREQEETNRRNQEAILRLLDELSALADGDLTIQTTVTGEFTGAICDSINFTIEQLRSLVSTINDTAVKVSSSALETQSTAMQLAEASEHQAQEISGASAAITEMASSIDQVSANAAESALVAERSVTIANKGSIVVHNTTRGMDTIREQIQETAKRIKRLGESSQEIGDIVSLITDIADQTNILALNAAIQASMAGDAGRGFAVVADEVQRLAERSSAATKQIEAIVRTIQTDTNEAVTSMEHTTAEVVRGTRLSQDAGIALEEIENVSRSLADLIQNISNAARQQSASAGHISNTMNVIQEITSQTSSGTIATAKSIGNLAGLAVEMRKTVAGFKLPEN